MEQPFLFVADLTKILPEIAPDTIISRTFFSDGQMKAILFGFAPGQELSEHTASKAAILHFIQGEALVTLGSEMHEVQAGAWIHMKANLKHSVQAHTPVVMVLMLLENR